MNKFIEMKHWHLLVSMFLPDIVINILDLTRFWQLIGTIWGCFIYIFWLFSVGNKVYRVNSNSQFRVFLFKSAFVYPLFYIVFVTFENGFSESFATWLIPFHFLAMISVFYLISFVSKNFYNFEKKQGVESWNVFTIFCAFWFFPIGVFFVQPLVNQVGIQNLDSDYTNSDISSKV